MQPKTKYEILYEINIEQSIAAKVHGLEILHKAVDAGYQQKDHVALFARDMSQVIVRIASDVHSIAGRGALYMIIYQSFRAILETEQRYADQYKIEQKHEI